MKILNWVQSKFNGKPVNKTSIHAEVDQGTQNDCFNELPHGLLAIGTLGNSSALENSKTDHEETDHDLEIEEKDKLQNELKKLFSLIPISSFIKSELRFSRKTDIMLMLEKILNSHLGLDAIQKVGQRFCEELVHRGGESRDSKHRKSSFLDNDIKQKPISLLLKKWLVCTSGVAPLSCPRDSQESSTQKLLKTILHQKICPQSPTGKKNCLDNKAACIDEETAEAAHKARNNCKWVKTDSEYIVLEI